MKGRSPITLSKASPRDAGLLAKMNRQMIADEGYKGRLSSRMLENRIRDWLRSGEYEAYFFLDHEGSRVGYALFQKQENAPFFAERRVFLRHFFIARNRRKEGIGTRAFRALEEDLWKGVNRVDLHVLIKNRRAVGFWYSLGFREYQFGMELEIPES